MADADDIYAIVDFDAVDDQGKSITQPAASFEEETKQPEPTPIQAKEAESEKHEEA
jgi:hypothetical protein